MKDYEVIISDDDKESIAGFGIKHETIVETVKKAIWRIKSVRADGVHFMEEFEEGGKPYILHGHIKYYKKMGYIFEFEGIGVVEIFHNRKTGEVQYFGEEKGINDKE